MTEGVASSSQNGGKHLGFWISDFICWDDKFTLNIFSCWGGHPSLNSNSEWVGWISWNIKSKPLKFDIPLEMSSTTYFFCRYSCETSRDYFGEWTCPPKAEVKVKYCTTPPKNMYSIYLKSMFSIPSGWSGRCGILKSILLKTCFLPVVCEKSNRKLEGDKLIGAWAPAKS